MTHHEEDADSLLGRSFEQDLKDFKEHSQQKFSQIQNIL